MKSLFLILFVTASSALAQNETKLNFSMKFIQQIIQRAVAIVDQSKGECSGYLLDNETIMTAYHCVKDGSSSFKVIPLMKDASGNSLETEA